MDKGFRHSIHVGNISTSQLNTLMIVEGPVNLEGDVNRFLEQLKESMSQRDIVFTQIGSNGYIEDGKIIYINKSPRTVEHEKAHLRLHEVWASPENSFDESFAHAYADYFHSEGKFAEKRRDWSLQLSPYHLEISKIQSNGGLKEEDYARIKEIVNGSSLYFSDQNLPAFLQNVMSFRFYSVFYDTIATFGPEEGEELIFEAAKIAQKTGRVLRGVAYLTEILETYQESGIYDFNMLPFRHPRLFGRENKVADISNENIGLRIRLNTVDEIVPGLFGEALEGNKEALENLYGPLKGYVKPGLEGKILISAP